MIEFTRFLHCPRCGASSIEVRQPNAMHCTACDYLYFHNTACAVAGIIEEREGIILLVRGHQPKAGFYDLPGGFVNYRESAEEALKREIREELGVGAAITSYFGSFPNRYVYHDVVYFTTDIVFLCSLETAAASIVCSDEVQSWEVFPVSALPLEKIAFESISNALGAYRSRLLRGQE
jgi:ADP-ribose pyrophosphatase YjhB (NUDIX family)